MLDFEPKAIEPETETATEQAVGADAEANQDAHNDSAPNEDNSAETNTEDGADGTDSGSDNGAGDGAADTDGADNQDNQPAAITIPVNVDGEQRNLTPEEAANYAEIAIRAEPLMEKLRYCAAMSGKTVEETIDGIIAADEQIRLQNILSEVGGNEEAAKKLFDIEKEKHSAAAKQMAEAEKQSREQDKQDITERLAGEFLKLSEEIPEIKSVDDIPDEVLKIAYSEKVTLFDAYLRFQNSEKKKIDAAETKRKAAAAASAGPQSKSADENTSPEKEELLKAIWG